MLITGANGYVGGRLAHAYAGRRPLRLAVRAGRAPALPPADGIEHVQIDLASPDSLQAACEGVDDVVHLAALNYADSQKDPHRAFEVNTLGTLRLVRACEAARVKRLVYFSTAHVYGSPLAGEISEATVTRPSSIYAMTRRAAEDIVLAARDRATVAGIVLRLSNAMGAPASAEANAWMLVANDLCRQAVTTGRLTLATSGLQRRDIIPLADVATAVEHVLSLDATASGDGLFDLGGENAMRIADLADLVAARCEKVLSFRPPVVRPPPRADETSPPLVYRIDKLKATGFRPRASVESEIDATLALCERTFGKGR